jgi:hypothetical protein
MLRHGTRSLRRAAGLLPALDAAPALRQSRGAAAAPRAVAKEREEARADPTVSDAKVRPRPPRVRAREPRGAPRPAAARPAAAALRTPPLSLNYFALRAAHLLASTPPKLNAGASA